MTHYKKRAPKAATAPAAPAEPTPAPVRPITYTYASTQGAYDPSKGMCAPPSRPGAMAAHQLPSRMNGRLHYPERVGCTPQKDAP